MKTVLYWTGLEVWTGGTGRSLRTRVFIPFQEGFLLPQLIDLMIKDRLRDLQYNTTFFDIDSPCDCFRYYCDRLYYILYEVCFQDRIVIRFSKQELCFKSDEVGLSFPDIFLWTLRCLLFLNMIRIFAIGQEDNLYIHSFFEDQVDTPDRRFDTGGITIIQDGDVLMNLFMSLTCPGKWCTEEATTFFNICLMQDITSVYPSTR